MDLIYDIPVLMKSAERMANEQPGILNLVRPDWQKVLHNNPQFQSFQSRNIPFHDLQPTQNGSIQKIPLANTLNVVMAGKWIFSERNGKVVLFSQECEPLKEITKALTSDITCDDTRKVVEQARFMIDNCNPAYCSWCRKVREDNNIPIKSDSTQWCIIKTQIFDGKKNRNALKSQIMSNFRGRPFCGILNIQITCRLFYLDSNKTIEYCKLSGICKSMILFKEGNLIRDPEFEIDFLGNVEPEIPASCECDEENVPVHDEMDFLNTVNLAMKRSSENEEETNFLKKIKTTETDKQFDFIPLHLNTGKSLEKESSSTLKRSSDEDEPLFCKKIKTNETEKKSNCIPEDFNIDPNFENENIDDYKVTSRPLRLNI